MTAGFAFEGRYADWPRWIGKGLVGYSQVLPCGCRFLIVSLLKLDWYVASWRLVNLCHVLLKILMLLSRLGRVVSIDIPCTCVVGRFTL